MLKSEFQIKQEVISDIQKNFNEIFQKVTKYAGDSGNSPIFEARLAFKKFEQTCGHILDKYFVLDLVKKYINRVKNNLEVHGEHPEKLEYLLKILMPYKSVPIGGNCGGMIDFFCINDIYFNVERDTNYRIYDVSTLKVTTDLQEYE